MALHLKDLLIKCKTANGLHFTEDVMDIMWLDNSETGDIYVICRLGGPYSEKL